MVKLLRPAFLNVGLNLVLGERACADRLTTGTKEWQVIIRAHGLGELRAVLRRFARITIRDKKVLRSYHAGMRAPWPYLRANRSSPWSKVTNVAWTSFAYASKKQSPTAFVAGCAAKGSVILRNAASRLRGSG